ncbi:MAG: hypothetical protein QOE93_438 [Actinomycetota bacterium]|jgi:hypothetical protein|nr:hypothetical protein [Actinomycetota bacterium]
MSDARPVVCRESDEWGAELALGLLSGPERAAALSHLARCPRCRESVDELAQVGDRLLLLAPEAEPPAGFESRVLAAVASADTRPPLPAHRGRGPRFGLVAALVAAAALAGGLVATTLGTPPAVDEAGVIRTGLAVSQSGRVSCRVVVTGDRPATVLVSLDGYPGADADVRVEMETVGGAPVALAPLHVAAGHGLLVQNVDVEAGDLRLMRMFDRDGRVIYEAMLADEPAR